MSHFVTIRNVQIKAKSKKQAKKHFKRFITLLDANGIYDGRIRRLPRFK